MNKDISSPSAYLLTWNPSKWFWEDLEDCTDELRKHGLLRSRWSCGTTRKIEQGDRLFIVRLGSEPRGIFASGWAKSSVYEDDHWNEVENDKAYYVDLELDVLLNPDVEEILGLEALNVISFQQHWTPQNSGIRIRYETINSLEKEWRDFLNSSGKSDETEDTVRLPEEVDNVSSLHEGATLQITINAYERNPRARKLCIEHYGSTCCVCEFDFGKVYGEVGEGFIHVHHLKPLSEIKEDHEVDPIRDLRPVCPNCHAMIHKTRTAYSVDEVRGFLSS